MSSNGDVRKVMNTLLRSQQDLAAVVARIALEMLCLLDSMIWQHWSLNWRLKRCLIPKQFPLEAITSCHGDAPKGTSGRPSLEIASMEQDALSAPIG
jgi:hypothetical protein